MAAPPLPTKASFIQRGCAAFHSEADTGRGERRVRWYPGPEWAVRGEEGLGPACPTPVLRAGPGGLGPRCLKGHPRLKAGMAP